MKPFETYMNLDPLPTNFEKWWAWLQKTVKNDR